MTREMPNTVTFHTNGEDPGWLHGWAETEQALARGESVHATQMELIDSYWVHHCYAKVILDDEGRSIAIPPDGKRWRAGATQDGPHGSHGLLHLWQHGAFDEDGSRPTRGQALRRASCSPTGCPSPRIGSDGRRSVTCHVDGTGSWAIHGWLSSCVLLEVGMSFATTQVSLLDDWRVREFYDEVVIESGKGSVTLDDDGTHWRMSGRGMRIPKTDSLLELWKSGGFAVA